MVGLEQGEMAGELKAGRGEDRDLRGPGSTMRADRCGEPTEGSSEPIDRVLLEEDEPVAHDLEPIDEPVELGRGRIETDVPDGPGHAIPRGAAPKDVTPAAPYSTGGHGS